MEIKNALNKLDPYITRLDADKPGTRQQFASVDRVPDLGDTVDIKSAGLKNAVMEAVEAAPDFRADKVEALKARIADGSYEVSSRDIAAKMLQAGRELFQ